ncbi:hypothetical protein GQ457_09G011480 [Hibiscus cannabinus]
MRGRVRREDLFHKTTLEESKIVTVFVSNLPQRLHWKGLWATFAHHGDVVDAFIPMKKNNDGKRFGFVRFSKKIDAQRAISRLNGFVLFGYRIFVSLARFNVRNKFWRKVSSKVNLEDKDGDFIQVSNESPSPDCVEGIIDKVVLERLSSCIIATTKKTCSAENLSNLLREKGLDEFEVRQVGGNQFVLDFDREELVFQCLNWEWLWLTDIFIDLGRWYKEFALENRVTWVAVHGVPLFAWNSFTFNNIINRLGEILYLEDEELIGSDFSIKRAKILTNQLNFIEETLSFSCDESNVAKSPKPPVGKAGDSSDSVSSADKVDKCSVVARLADGVRAFQTMDEADDTANKECFNEPTSSKECFNELIPEKRWFFL